jgi:Domain of unknown function (DUF4386)
MGTAVLTNRCQSRRLPLPVHDGNFAEFYARGRLIVAGDAAQTAKNIAASERLFRIGTVSNLITFAGVVPLVVALYVVLNPINRNVALLAAFWRLAECSIFAFITLHDFVALRLLSGADYLRAFDTQQLEALAYTFVGVHDAGYLIGRNFGTQQQNLTTHCIERSRPSGVRLHWRG